MQNQLPGEQNSKISPAIEPSWQGLARHSESQQRQHLLALICTLILALSPYFLLSRNAFEGDIGSHVTIELVGGLFGMFTGFALILRFYSLGNRYHLLIGLAFFVTGIEDLIHIRFWLRDLLAERSPLATELLPLTYVTGQFLMGLMLIAALVLPAWIRVAPSRKAEAIRGSLIVLLVTTFAAAVLSLSGPQVQSGSVRPLQTIDVMALVALVAAFAGYLARYQRSHEMLDWWITTSLGVNAVGQFLMLASNGPYDAYFVLAHLYKVAGYMIPLVGFFLYQIVIVLEYDRSQRDLIEAREQALAAARAKSEFLANMSHEIRTPMNGVLGMTERALRTTLSHQQREFLNAAHDSASSLLGLLDDILDVSKIEAGKFDLHAADFSLRECIDSALLALATSAQDKGLELKLDVAPDLPDWLHGDSRRLRQVLVNLVGNAIKFTLQGSVEVDVRPAQLDAHQDSTEYIPIEFSVRDTGIGIPEEKQRVIFDVFSQADGSTTRRFGGTGLGLAISRELVEMMGGRIWVESRVGQGSVFHFTVRLRSPIEQPPQPAHLQSSLAPTYASRRAKILLAEDNEINRRVVVATLQEMGHDVLLAGTGTEALAILQRHDVDLILMDLQMPELSGLDAAKRIRELELRSAKRTPIVALTAHAMSEDRNRCLQAGMDDYLSKPVSERDLFQCIERLLSPAPLQQSPMAATADAAASSGILDRDRLMSQVRGDDAVLSELVGLFENQSDTIITEMRSALSKQDSQGLTRAAHKLAGSAGNFHSPAVVESARILQSHAKDEQWDRAAAEFDRLTALIQRLRAKLAETLAAKATK